MSDAAHLIIKIDGMKKMFNNNLIIIHRSSELYDIADNQSFINLFSEYQEKILTNNLMSDNFHA